MTIHQCPECRCKEEDDAFAPRPATSSEWARRQAKEAAAAAVAAAKERRTGAGR